MTTTSYLIAVVAALAGVSPAVAESACRQFVPGADLVIEVPCLDLQPSDAARWPTTVPLPPTDTRCFTPPTALSDPTPQSVIDRARCVEILERTQHGRVNADEMTGLSTQCK